MASQNVTLFSQAYLLLDFVKIKVLSYSKLQVRLVLFFGALSLFSLSESSVFALGNMSIFCLHYPERHKGL